MPRRAVMLIITGLALVFVSGAAPNSASSRQSDKEKLTTEEAKLLKSPVPFTKSSIGRGRTLFANECTACHGPDGQAQVDVVADATNLTDPALWKSGVAEGEIFRSIRDGAGLTMPPYKTLIRKEEDMWHLVNFIRSLWPEPQRPKLQAEKAN
ncbi:MAG: cytochrome c [Acidobacteria bacterium]|nr:cytochrome c [Acidobacteriota bacterium]MBI3424382.1 cytochrome c [Acidobacteriota bacterium]